MAALSVSHGAAEEKCKISGSVAVANTTYTQQHVMDVGDMPGHQVRSSSCTTPILQIPSQTARGSGAQRIGGGAFPITPKCRQSSRRSRSRSAGVKGAGGHGPVIWAHAGLVLTPACERAGSRLGRYRVKRPVRY